MKKALKIIRFYCFPSLISPFCKNNLQKCFKKTFLGQMPINSLSDREIRWAPADSNACRTFCFSSSHCAYCLLSVAKTQEVYSLFKQSIKLKYGHKIFYRGYFTSHFNSYGWNFFLSCNHFKFFFNPF